MNADQKEQSPNSFNNTLHKPDDPLLKALNLVIHLAVRVLAVFMTIVIVWGVIDLGRLLYLDMMKSDTLLLIDIKEIFALFGAFMSVLIAIEIFSNITVYLRDDVIHVKIVMATALMAVARKVIILDLEQKTTWDFVAVAAVVLAMSVGYYLVVVKDRECEKKL